MIAPKRFGPMSIDVQIPKGFLPKVRWFMAYGASWMLPLVAIERFADEHYFAGWILSILSVVDWIIASQWDRFASMLERPDGVEFFPDRDALQHCYGSLPARLSNVSTAYVIWTVGHDFYAAGEHLDVVKELLLPSPDGEAIKFFGESVDREAISNEIREATKLAQKKGAKVKWYDHYIFQSTILADVDKQSGWIHIELVLPYSKRLKRPSFTIRKSNSPETVEEMTRLFRKWWNVAKEPPDWRPN
jgi:hypothetical protein